MSEPEIIYPTYPQGYPPSFVAFHEKNPWIYDALVMHARLIKKRGWPTAGVRYLFEHVRYSEAMRTNLEASAGVEYGLDNNFAAHYGRLMESREESLRGFFRMRRTRAELAAPDPSQLQIDFD